VPCYSSDGAAAEWTEEEWERGVNCLGVCTHILDNASIFNDHFKVHRNSSPHTKPWSRSMLKYNNLRWKGIKNMQDGRAYKECKIELAMHPCKLAR
jgi:hypothetical protein